MYDTFKEQEQYSILMEILKSQNKEYIELKSRDCIQKEAEYIRIKYSLTHFDIGMAKRHLKRKIGEKNLKRIENKKHYKMPDSTQSLDIRPNYFSKERIAVYTVMFGGYDWINEPVVVPDNADFYIITDISNITNNSTWKMFDDTRFRKYTDNLDTAIKNRWYKTHPHILFPDYQYSLYVDSSIKIITDVTEHINKIGQIGMSIHRHPMRDCAYDELDAVKCCGKDSIQNLYRMEKLYDKINFPRHYGLPETMVIARKHNEKNVINIMEDWWKYIEKYSRRDQLSLPIDLYRHGIKTDDVCGLGNNIRENYAFRWEAHMGHYDRIKNAGI